MITEKQIKLLEKSGVPVRNYDGSIKQLGNIAKYMANAWGKMSFEVKNELQKEFIGLEITSRQEYTNILKRKSIKLTDELTSAIRYNAEIGEDITMMNASDILYETIDKAIDNNKLIDISSTSSIEKNTTLIEYAGNNNLAFIVEEENEAERLRNKFKYEHIYSRLEVKEELNNKLSGALIDDSVPYSEFDNIPLKLKTGLVNIRKGR